MLGLLAKDPGERPTLTYTMEALTYVRDAYGPGHRSGSMPPRPSMPLAPSSPTWAPPNHQSATTIGRSQGEQLLTARREPSKSSWKLAIVGVLVLAAGAISVVLATRGGDDKAAAVPPPAPADAAITVTAPVDAAAAPPDAAVVAAPVDAAPIVAAPADAAEVAVTVDAGDPVPAGKKPPKKPRAPKPPGNGTTTKPPPPDDDDGLLQVQPKKK